MIYALLNQVGTPGSVDRDTTQPFEKTSKRPVEKSVLAEPVGFYVHRQTDDQEHRKIPIGGVGNRDEEILGFSLPPVHGFPAHDLHDNKGGYF